MQNVPECMHACMHGVKVPESSRMFQNACKMFQNACMHACMELKFQKVPECSRMHAKCSIMHAECSRMHACMHAWS